MAFTAKGLFVAGQYYCRAVLQQDVTIENPLSQPNLNLSQQERHKDIISQNLFINQF
jgi:hypothetical protein